jgi:hypothetical protein
LSRKVTDSYEAGLQIYIYTRTADAKNAMESLIITNDPAEPRPASVSMGKCIWVKLDMISGICSVLSQRCVKETMETKNILMSCREK